METKKVLIAIISVIVIAVVVYLVVTQVDFKKTETSGGTQTPVLLENYDSISNGVVEYGDKLTLNTNGYLMITLSPGDYIMKYDLTQCTNPSKNFDYSKTSPSGETVSYDPLNEKLVLTTDGKYQKVALTESEKLSALVNEKVYVLKVDNTGFNYEKAILGTGLVSFNAKDQTKISFQPKCDDAKVVLNVYQ